MMSEQIRASRPLPLKVSYGNPSPLNEEDRRFLKELDEKVWNRSSDRFGAIHSFPKRTLTREEESRVLQLIGAHVLPCVMGSGPYGELSFSVYGHTTAPGSKPECLASFGEDHLSNFGKDRAFERWKFRFEAMSALTHCQRNRQILSFYGMPAPRRADEYSY